MGMLLAEGGEMLLLPFLLDVPLTPTRQIGTTSFLELFMPCRVTLFLLCFLAAPAWGQSREPVRLRPAPGSPVDSLLIGEQSDSFFSPGRQASSQPGRAPQSALTIGLAATLVPVTAGLMMWSANPDPSAAALVIAGGVILGPALPNPDRYPR